MTSRTFSALVAFLVATNALCVRACDIHAALATCASAPPHGKDACKDACTEGLMNCADNPGLASHLSGHQIGKIKELRDGCRNGGSSPPPPPCDISDFATGSAFQSAMKKGGICCTPGDEGCDNGKPMFMKTCPAACAKFLPAFWARCKPAYSKLMGTTAASVWANLVAKCSGTSPPPPPCDFTTGTGKEFLSAMEKGGICCPPGDEACDNGKPMFMKTCPAACAKFLPAFYARCKPAYFKLMGWKEGAFDPWASLVAKCSGTSPPPPPCDIGDFATGSAFQSAMEKGGICCTPGDEGCDNGKPMFMKTCPAACAKFLPAFWARCKPAYSKLMGTTAASVVEANLVAKCSGGH